jgi:hypothetical protein
MSTIQKVNFEPVSNLLHVQTKDFGLADPTLANPLNALALVDGEWMTLDASNKLVRACNVATAGNAATGPSWVYWAEKGRTDVQAGGNRKGPVFWLGEWEADTRIYLSTSMTQLGLVSVASVDIGGKIVSALVDNGTFASAGAGVTVGIITRLPATNNGKLRIRGGMFF